MKTINNFDFKNKKALIRVDFNVPQNDNLEVTDATRIIAAKPTIIKVLQDGGSVILMSHLGRPNGQIDEKLSLKNIVNNVSEVLGIDVKFAPKTIGNETEELVNNLDNGEVLLLENLRFYSEEKKGDEEFAKKLASYADIYVNDAFGTAHRAHASTSIIAKFFDENKCFGNLLEKELLAIDKVLKTGEKPITAILGGAKVSSKITIIENILPVVDNLIIGGGMIFTFVKAKGGEIGNSLVEDDKLELALNILQKAKENNVKVYIPVDVIAADSFSNDANTKIFDVDKIEDGWQGLDVGEKSLQEIKQIILESKTILWNGPLGVFEFENFANGTIELGNYIADSTARGAFSLVGGGDSVAAVKKFGFEEKVSYVSTGGGAMLESLEGITLPGVAAILE